jgi:DNA-binding response OmpR family regulator
MSHILLADPDLMNAKLTSFILTDAGHTVGIVSSGKRALEYIEREHPDLLLLDRQLVDMDGFELCRRIRSFSLLSIIFLCRPGSLAERVLGLESGADDYITKPYEPSELLARIAAVQRRYQAGMKQHVALTRGTITLNPAERLLDMGSAQIELTPIECQLLHILMLNAGRILNDQALLTAAWGASAKGRNLLTVYIYRLRSKLSPEQPTAAPIITIRGQGYMFVEENSVENARAVSESYQA